MTPPFAVHLGWDDARDAEWEALRRSDLTPARVARVDRGVLSVWVDGPDERRVTTASVAKHAVTGDWVGLELSADRVEVVLERRSRFVRRAARGAVRAQVVVANVDVVGICQPLDGGLQLRRLERELVLAHDSGAQALVVLTKADLVSSAAIESARRAALTAAGDVPVIVTSAFGTDVSEFSVAPLTRFVQPGSTLALLGASGAGKSALVNALAGAGVQATGAVRSGDRKGRHTTTATELVWLGDRVVVDTPGMRALALWDAWTGLHLTFPEMTIAECRFADCSHRNEPGCSVSAAIAAGTIDADRYEHWRRLSDELTELDELRRAAERAAADQDNNAAN
jgi:ribosome biogenesis GTPase